MSKLCYVKWCCLSVAVALLVACSSSVVLGKVYDGFGSQMAKRFKSFATFNSTQKQEIDVFAKSYHSWHRTTQLDRYAALLGLMVSDVDASDQLSYEKADNWFQSIRGFSDDMRACNPFNVSAELLAGMSDKQVAQMTTRMRERVTKREQEYLDESPAERIEEQMKSMLKWGPRIGASFNDEQKTLLRKTLTSQISMGAQRYELRHKWIQQFAVILGKREQPGFTADVTHHIDTLWRITETNFPDQWKSNEQLWTVFFKDYINLQTAEQRVAFVERARSTAETLGKLADKEVEVVPVCHSS